MHRPMWEREGTHLWLAQKYTRSISNTHLTPFAKLSFAMQQSTYGVTGTSGGLSLPCSSSALMNSHTPKLNNCRHIGRHTKTGNHKKFSCFLCLFSAFLKNSRIAPRKGNHDTLFVLRFSIFGGVGNERKMKKILK